MTDEKEKLIKQLYSPFTIEKDTDYLPTLKEKYKIFKEVVNIPEFDSGKIELVDEVTKSIIRALTAYYAADIYKCNAITKKLVKRIKDDKLASGKLYDSCGFPRSRIPEINTQINELQFFRGRIGNPSVRYEEKEMIGLPSNLRSKSGNYRFSIPGNPSLYLSNTSYCCWIENGCPPEELFNVSPFLVDENLKIFNLAVRIRDLTHLNYNIEGRSDSWLILQLLAMACSFVCKEQDRTFKSEYIISQSIMMACKKLGYDGIAYYSNRVSDKMFGLCAINLVLISKYRDKYLNCSKHIKTTSSFNYYMFRILPESEKMKNFAYPLAVTSTGLTTNIGTYDNQYPYKE